MCRKLICLVSSVLVLMVAGTASAELVAHWPLNEGSGTTAYDIVGGNDGTFVGDPQWVTDLIGDALEFDGDGDYIEVPHSDSLNTTDAVTVAMWAWASDQRDDGSHQLIEKGPGSSAWFSTFGLMTAEQYMVDNLGVTSLHSLTFRGTSTPGRGDGFWSDSPMPAGEWAHIAVTFDVDAEGNNRKIYLNGEVIAEDRSENPLDTNTERLLIGADAYSTTRWWWHGMLNDVRIYNNALTEAEVLAVMAREPLPFAFGPDPRVGAMLDVTWANILWKAGDFAVSHNMYFGTSFDDVNEGAEGTFVGNLATTSQIVGFASFPVPDGLQPGTTYYWRVDEVNDADPNSPWKGDVWSFWIQPRTAYSSSPADGAINVLEDVTLSWTVGMGASLHQVYFGDNLDDVSNASGAALQSDATYTPSALEAEKTYYWRVDEFDSTGATHPGDVWSFTTVPDIAVTDPDLQGWWTFDEGQGTTALDWSGHGNHGSVEVEGDPLWVDGFQGSAMDMAGKTAVRIPAEAWSTIENQVTVAMWTYGDPAGVPNSVVCAAYQNPGNGQTRVFSVHIPWGGNVYFDSGGATDGYDRIFKASSPGEHRGNWRHWTFVKNAETGSMEIFLDGQLWYTETGMTRTMTGVTAFTLGRHPDGANPYRGIMDDVRLYNKALTAEQIAEVMLGNTKLAGGPDPDSHATVDIRDISSLSWSAGDAAASHDVYFGQDRDVVAGADSSAPEFQGNQAGASLSLASLVEFGGGDYYWRIDEVAADGTATAGTVWKFTVPDYLIVDDFESYNDIDEGEPGSNRIYLTWIDGYGTTNNGSQAGNLDPPFMSQGRSSAQAMPLLYDNVGKTSEATRTLVSKKDWTEHDVTKLSLWFSGDSANAADRMFVALGNAVVYHPDDAATQDGGWNEWVIDLQEFANQGADLTNVGSITLGFGARGAPVPTGGTGTVHFDDIGLIR